MRCGERVGGVEGNGGGSGKEGSAVEAEQEAWVLQTDAYKAFSHPPKLNFNKISHCFSTCL